MAGLCEGGNEPSGSLKAICNMLFNDAVSTTKLFSVNEIGDSEMVFGEMRPSIRHRLPDIYLTFGENLEKESNQMVVELQDIFLKGHRRTSGGTMLARCSGSELGVGSIPGWADR
ncbi:hypothetical protein ANN_16570 [Periplaneta americana]|uniref:Uncharacterized protein n=1 Tax=Periplaneta americana TaxID=6978 RepID=A0ABQ8SQR9_PERAM|nr:hypothetical protein ANN_16570 [Periplaneta americana]